MSNIYIQEPPALGKVLLKTSVGDIDLELWTKEAPKACRNFIQLCMEGYYNGTIFHRLVPEFIVQGGDPKGDGTGGESIYGAPFKDEFHSRLRFNRRGLVAMANAGKDDNSSQFFFTLNATPELQNKHTIFGKVTGETIFNMLKLAEGLTDSDDRPLYPHRIVSTEVLINTFTDIVPRIVQKKEKDDAGKKKKKERAGVKNYKLLSFGEEAEEDEDQTTEYRGKPKSTHDVLDDPKLSRLTGSDLENEDEPGSSNAVEKEVDEATRAAVSSIRDKLQAKNKKPLEVDKKTEENNEVKSDEEIEEYYLGKDRKEARKKEAEEIRRQISDLKREMSGKKKEAAQAEIEKEEEKKRTTNELKEEYELEQEKYRKKKEELPAKGASRHNQNEDENYQERKPWVKNLYENTGHYPDNYTDIKFLEQMRRNVNPHNVTFLESFLGSCRLSNKIASCVLFSVVFTYLYNEWITVHDVFTYSSGITMLGYLFFILARSVNTSRVETSTKKDAKKVNVKEKLNKKYCDESEDLNTEIMFETNMRNYLRRSANKKKDKNFSVKVIENKKDKSKNTSDSVSYLIFGDLKTVLIFLVFGYIVSPILHTLTDTVSTDTIFATCAIMMLIHLIFSDYGISAAIVSNSLSINAAIFGSICLSSRLSTSFHAFVLLTVAVECFVLQPILTSLLLNTPYSILIYTVNISSAFIFLWSVSKTIFYLFAFTIFLVNFYWPLLFIRWQKYKDNIYGPWDEAVVHDSDNIEECIGDTIFIYKNLCLI